MKSRTITTTPDHKKVNYDALYYIRKIKRLENQAQKLKIWILKNMDPGCISVTNKMELYRLLTL